MKLFRNSFNLPSWQIGGVFNNLSIHTYHSGKSHTDTDRLFLALGNKFSNNFCNTVKDILFAQIGICGYRNGLNEAVLAIYQGSFYICTKIGRDTSELQSRGHLVCRLLLEKKKKK